MMKRRPVVLAVTRRTIRKNKYVDFLGEYHLRLLVRLGILPVMVPVVEGTLACLGQYMERMEGLLLIEGPDIEPTRYAARKTNFQYLEETHRLKDEIEIRLLGHALRRRIPYLGFCRGSELLNVVCGGTLYGDVQKEKRSGLRHIDYDHYDVYRHRIRIVADTPLAQWYGQEELMVNSYHHQGIRRLASRFRSMAYADDGLIEGYYDPQEDFLVGLQFHPERMFKDHAGNWRVWQAFGAAVHRQLRK